MVVADNLVERLVEAQAEVNTRDNLGRTPLHYAIKHGHMDLAQRLREAGGVVKRGKRVR